MQGQREFMKLHQPKQPIIEIKQADDGLSFAWQKRRAGDHVVLLRPSSLALAKKASASMLRPSSCRTSPLENHGQQYPGAISIALSKHCNAASCLPR
jgi:hypothetical protein